MSKGFMKSLINSIKLFKSDVIARYGKCNGFACVIRVMANPSLRACLLVRFCMSGNEFISIISRNILITMHSMDVGKGALAGSEIYFPHPVGIVIGEGVVIGSGVTIYQNVTLGKLKGSYPVVGDNVTIYPNSILIGDIKLESGFKVKPGSIMRGGDK